MPLMWWQKKKEDGAELSDEEKKELEAQNKKLDEAAKAAAELPEIKAKLSKLDKLDQWLEDQKKEKEAAEKIAREKKTVEQQQTTDEEIEALMLTDPKKAIAMATAGQQNLLLTLRADNIKREVFEDAEKFKYYHGDIKSEVDKLLAAQSLTARNDPSVVENCYKTVLGNHIDEITEGKLKTRFAGSESSSRGTSSGSAGSSSTSSKESRVIPDDVKKLAKQFGVTPEDYADMLDKEGIGYA